MINLNAEKDNRVFTVNGSVFISKFVMSLVPLLPKLIARSLDGLAFIWLILNHCNVEVQFCCKV